MSTSQFVPLDISGIEEGNFVKTINDELLKVQDVAVAYAKKHGERAKGSKTKLIAEITLLCEDPKSEIFSIKTQLKKTLPALPPTITSAIAGQSQDDQSCLFVRFSGSTADSPRQGIFDEDEADTKAVKKQ